MDFRCPCQGYANGQSLTLPVYIQPGIKRKSVYIAVGYGHEGLGEVANGKGVNAYNLIAGSQSAGLLLKSSPSMKKSE